MSILPFTGQLTPHMVINRHSIMCDSLICDSQCQSLRQTPQSTFQACLAIWHLTVVNKVIKCGLQVQAKSNTCSFHTLYSCDFACFKQHCLVKWQWQHIDSSYTSINFSIPLSLMNALMCMSQGCHIGFSSPYSLQSNFTPAPPRGFQKNQNGWWKCARWQARVIC